jgi:hypothetical protein
MGITIHYAGRAASEASIDAIFEESLAVARAFAWRRHVPPPKERRESGVTFLPHDNCEPLHIWFSRSRRFSDFCKTQFAGPAVHLQVREFLERLSPHFSKLIVYDEAEDFEEEGKLLPIHDAFHKAHEFIKQGLIEHPTATMMVRLPSGRIADLVE